MPAEVPVSAWHVDEGVLLGSHIHRIAADRGGPAEVPASHRRGLFQELIHRFPNRSCLSQYPRWVNEDVDADRQSCRSLGFRLCFLSADIDKALSIFNELRKQDPYRIENMDTFSNLLYVRVICFSWWNSCIRFSCLHSERGNSLRLPFQACSRGLPFSPRAWSLNWVTWHITSVRLINTE